MTHMSATRVIKLYEQQSGCCLYCRDRLTDCEGVQIDHLVPASIGGRNCIDNYALACNWCNNQKRTHSYDWMIEFIRPYTLGVVGNKKHLRDYYKQKPWNMPSQSE